MLNCSQLSLLDYLVFCKIINNNIPDSNIIIQIAALNSVCMNAFFLLLKGTQRCLAKPMANAIRRNPIITNIFLIL